LEGLERLPSGLALVDADSRLLYANASARSAFGHVGWMISGGGLRCRSFNEQLSWGRALKEVCLRRQRQLFDLHAPSGRSFVALVPVCYDDATRVLVTFGREELCGSLELQMFASQHGLTFAEGQVLRKLSLGLSPAEIASDHGVSVTTVATQVASLRAKTGLGSVRQLLTVLSRLPPIQPALAGQRTACA
jgi:DNA-binding CsgD family transcriptional regulator